MEEMMDNKNTNGDEQQKFLEILNALVEQAKKKENVLNFEDVEKAFSKVGVELDADKTEKVFEFLENKGIVAMVPDSSADDDIILDVDDEPTEEELENKYPDKNILVVCHGGIVRVIHSYFYDMTNKDLMTWLPQNCCIQCYEK